MTIGRRIPFLFLLALLMLPIGALQSATVDSYQPLFSDEFLEQLDPETRARLSALDKENRLKWLANTQKLPPDMPEETRKAKIGLQQDSGIMYRYRDSNDEVHYSDSWLEGATAIRMDPNKPSQASLEAHEKTQREMARMLIHFDLKEEKVQKARAAAADARLKDAENCRNEWKKLREEYYAGFDVKSKDENGDTYYWSNAKLREAIARKETELRKECDEPPVNVDEAN